MVDGPVVVGPHGASERPRVSPRHGRPRLARSDLEEELPPEWFVEATRRRPTGVTMLGRILSLILTIAIIVFIVQLIA